MAPIDHNHLSAQTGGDPDLTREILDLFARQCRTLLAGITDSAQPARDRADLAHTLKGSALGVGAGAVAAASANLETDLRAGRAPDPTPLAEAVAEVLRAIPPT
ncbi:Hpt domain-containing protein [Methylobacterium gossipiicola]|uniref:HPt (Histidine-containing phosphotransfer) domain-containing protein n=1 Tax=Methylobacterium gossipiicola TaxID=582675 RepID=A0A1I2SQ32_9HYPH|nr:Hpt domain-containing protein [Methylobacterium gossipiicola]SFG54643.1 HPt (histidine-containing phosphotransfer) domain-containing protein [Methylobacterium gossipiicola]